MTAARPIVIVGCPRSGTTLLSTMLHSHPRIAIAPETRFLLPVYRDRLADPRAVLGALTDFLEEPFDEAMLSFSGAAADIVRPTMSWHDRTRGELDPRRAEAWREALTPTRQEAILCKEQVHELALRCREPNPVAAVPAP